MHEVQKLHKNERTALDENELVGATYTEGLVDSSVDSSIENVQTAKKRYELVSNPFGFLV